MSSLDELTTGVKSSVKAVDDLMGSIEAVALAVTTRAAAWVSTIPTVMLTSRTIASVFNLSVGAGMASSIALEVCGQACADLWLSAKAWNETKRKTDPAANERLALAMMTTYFVTDFVLVGVLELPKAFAGDLEHLASLLFPVMQVVSTIVLTERAKQFKRQTAIDADKAERSANRSGKRSESAQEDDAPLLADRSDAFTLGNLDAANRSRQDAKQVALNDLLNVYQDDPNLSYSAAGRRVGRSKSWVAGALGELEKAGRVHRNGGGVEILEVHNG
jgi:hypothetical protein